MSADDEFDVAVDGYFAIVPEWVIDAEISDRAVRLYAVLRRHANSRLMSRPSRAKLAERMRASLSSVDRALRELEAVGAVTIRHRWTNSKGDYVFVKDADHTVPAPSGYLLHNTPAVPKTEWGLVTGDDTPLVTSDHTLSSPVTTPLSSPVEGGVYSPVTHELKPIEPKPEKKKTSRSRSKPDDPEGFAEFWSAYPKRVARLDAVKAFTKAVKKATAEEITDGARRYLDDPNVKRGYIANPATWLNGERWNDEPPAGRSTPTTSGTTAESIRAMTAQVLQEI